MSTLALKLNRLEDTAELAQKLAKELTGKVVFLIGPLGSGKTTFTRFLVESLPGGNKAEVASPSFTLCNIYPTCPEVLHYDLYRLPRGHSDESLEEVLDTFDEEQANNAVLIIEWAENLPGYLIPPNRLEIYWHSLPNGREVLIKGIGKTAFMDIFKN